MTADHGAITTRLRNAGWDDATILYHRGEGREAEAGWEAAQIAKARSSRPSPTP